MKMRVWPCAPSRMITPDGGGWSMARWTRGVVLRAYTRDDGRQRRPSRARQLQWHSRRYRLGTQAGQGHRVELQLRCAVGSVAADLRGALITELHARLCKLCHAPVRMLPCVALATGLAAAFVPPAQPPLDVAPSYVQSHEDGVGAAGARSSTAPAGRLLFVSVPGNNLLASVRSSALGFPVERFDNVTGALVAARSDDWGLLVLADHGYPLSLTPMTNADYSAVAKLGLRLFVEFPSALPPGSAINSSNAHVGTAPLPMDQICGVSTTGTTTATRLVTTSNATGLEPLRILQQNGAVAIPLQLVGPQGPPSPPPPGPPTPATGCPRGYATHTPGYWSNPTPNTSSTKPPIPVPKCAAVCSADSSCVAFEVFDPSNLMQCHTFKDMMKQPFTPNANMVTCVKNNSDAFLHDDIAAHSAIAAKDRVFVVGARVAGYDHAVFGVPPSQAQQQVVLFAATDDILVSTTQLSNAVTARNGPIAAWGTLFEFIVGWVCKTRTKLPPLVATVRPRYSPTAKLPTGAEKMAVSAAISHLTDTSRLLYSRRFVSPPTDLNTLVQHCPTPDPADQENATCIDEGLSSYINALGNSSREMGTCAACGCSAKTNRDQICANTRTDDNAQSAVGIGVAGVLLNNSKYKLIAKAIVEYVYTTSGSQEHPANKSDGSRGLVDWFTVPAMVQRSSFWGDNDGTVSISTAALAGLLFDTDEMQQIVPKLLEQVFGLLRTTGTEGFRPASTSKGDMAKRGWRSFFDATIGVGPQLSIPHMQANAWAIALWAGHATGIGLFQKRVFTATRLLMDRWPTKWTCMQTETEELAHEVLVLAWLVRVNNTAQPRAWLDAVASDLIAHQRSCGAIKEWVNTTCIETFPTSNSGYGQGEGGLMQENTDPVADLLYAQNFALMSLHEAAHAIGLSTPAGQRYSRAVDQLAEFFVRVQVHSTDQPNIDGAWLRAVDVDKWEFWASGNDYGYGPWETETGWTIGWVSATLGMRQLNTSFWGAMQRTADAIDHNVARAVCMDFFEDLGETHCNKQAPDPPAPPTPTPAPPIPSFVDFSFSANWSSGGPATTLPAANFGVRKVEFIYYKPDGMTYAYADIVNYTDPFYPESCMHA